MRKEKEREVKARESERGEIGHTHKSKKNKKKSHDAQCAAPL